MAKVDVNQRETLAIVVLAKQLHNTRDSKYLDEIKAKVSALRPRRQAKPKSKSKDGDE